MAIPYVPTTHADAQSWTAAKANLLELAAQDAHLMPAARVTHNTTQSITTSTETTVAFNTERFDQVSGGASTIHDTVTNNSRLTCRHAGVYQISATVEFTGNSTGVRYVTLRVAGTTHIAMTRVVVTGDGTAFPLTVTSLYAMAVNDFVEVRVWQNSGISLNVLNTANYSPEFMMVRVA